MIDFIALIIFQQNYNQNHIPNIIRVYKLVNNEGEKFFYLIIAFWMENMGIN